MKQPALLLMCLMAFAALSRASGRPSLDAAGKAALSEVLRSHVAKSGPPAAVAIVVNAEEVLFLDAAGKRDVGQDAPATPDTIFRIASMTKPITSLAAMMLVEDRTIALDDPVAKHLPGFVQPPVVTAVRPDGAYDSRPATRAITVRDLLTHTSGIAYPFFDPVLRQLMKAGVADAAMPLAADPGTRFEYGPSTALLGRLVASASGQTLDDFCKTRIFDPLGMTDTAYAVPEARGDRVVTQHQRLADNTLVERANPATFASKGRGDDGLFSTARDYGTFMQLFLNHGRHHGRQIVGERTIDLMISNQIGPLTVQAIDSADPLVARAFPEGAGKDGFGFGFEIETPPSTPGRRSPGTLSWAGIFNTHFWIDPTRGVAAAVLMQMLPANDPAVVDLLTAFERTVYDRLR